MLSRTVHLVTALTETRDPRGTTRAREPLRMVVLDADPATAVRLVEEELRHRQGRTHGAGSLALASVTVERLEAIEAEKRP